MPIGVYQNLLAMGVSRASIGIDGTATVQVPSTAATSFTLTHTTTQANVLLVAVFISDNNVNITGGFVGTQAVSSFSGDGLTWTRKTQRQATESTGIDRLGLEVWTAVASTAATRTTTCTLPGNTKGSYVNLLIFGVFGANTTTPFDTNAGAEGYAQNMTITASLPSASITTSHANDMILQVTWGGTTGGNYATPTGFSELWNDTVNQAFHVTYQIVNATQSSVTYAEATQATNWQHLLEAIQGA